MPSLKICGICGTRRSDIVLLSHPTLIRLYNWSSHMGDKEYILVRHLLHSQTMDLENQVNKSNQDMHVWRMNGVW